MKSFNYVITDEVGIHARPAGILVKEAKKYASKVTVSMGGKSAVATKLWKAMMKRRRQPRWRNSSRITYNIYM